MKYAGISTKPAGSPAATRKTHPLWCMMTVEKHRIYRRRVAIFAIHNFFVVRRSPLASIFADSKELFVFMRPGV